MTQKNSIKSNDSNDGQVANQNKPNLQSQFSRQSNQSQESQAQQIIKLQSQEEGIIQRVVQMNRMGTQDSGFPIQNSQTSQNSQGNSNETDFRRGQVQ